MKGYRWDEEYTIENEKQKCTCTIIFDKFGKEKYISCERYPECEDG